MSDMLCAHENISSKCCQCSVANHQHQQQLQLFGEQPKDVETRKVVQSAPCKVVPQSTTSNQNWKTPVELVREIRRLGFNLAYDMTSRNLDEVAPGLLVGAREDGLSESWLDVVPEKELQTTWLFYNPPFKRIRKWVNKAVFEHKHYYMKSVGIAPANIETRWAKMVLDAEGTLLVLSPRVNFVQNLDGSTRTTGAPHATMLMILGGSTEYGDYGIFRHEWKSH